MAVTMRVQLLLGTHEVASTNLNETRFSGLCLGDFPVSGVVVVVISVTLNIAEMQVKRWAGEVGEALKQRGAMAQYHALALLHKLRKNDKLSVSKFVQSVNTVWFLSHAGVPRVEEWRTGCKQD